MSKPSPTYNDGLREAFGIGMFAGVLAVAIVGAICWGLFALIQSAMPG